MRCYVNAPPHIHIYSFDFNISSASKQASNSPSTEWKSTKVPRSGYVPFSKSRPTVTTNIQHQYSRHINTSNSTSSHTSDPYQNPSQTTLTQHTSRKSDQFTVPRLLYTYTCPIMCLKASYKIRTDTTHDKTRKN